MQNCHHQIVIIVIALFTILQLTILAIFGYTPYPDSNGYILLAEECINNNDLYPIASKINDYPFLWNIGAINITIASLRLFHSIIPLLVLYALMKGITAWFLYKITENIYSNKIAFFTLAIYVLYPANYGECTSLLSELPFMFFIMLGMYLSIVKNQTLIGGMMLALANWFRPMGIVFLLALMIYFIYQWHKSIKILVGYTLMICIIGFATMQRTGLFLYQAKTGWMALTDYSSDHMPASMAVRDYTEWNVSQKDSAWQSLFFEWLKDHPIEYAYQMPKKLVNTYVSDNVNMCTFIPDKDEKEYMYEDVSMGTIISSFPHYSAVQWWTIINLIIYLSIIIGSTISIFYFRTDTHLLPVSIIFIGTLVLLFVGHGEARFHTPFMPFFIILSATFINKTLWKG